MLMKKSFITSGPGCVVLVFSVASSVRVGLFLRLVDNLLPVRHTFVSHHKGTL